MSTVRIQVRRGTSSEWTSANPILAAGEMGVETNTNKFKFGNGSSTWTALSYAAADTAAIGEISQDAIDQALSMGAGLTKTYDDGANTITITVDTNVISTKAFASAEASAAEAAAIAAAESYTDTAISGVNNSLGDYIEVADRGVMNGVASLDANAKIPQDQLPLNVLTTNINTSGTVSAGTVTADNVTSADTLTANNVNISGNLTVTGTTTTVNSTNVSIEDPLIYIGDGNQSNVLDLGIVTAFNDGTYQHAGLVRDASDNGIWKLFAGVTTEPGATVDFTNYTKEDLEIGHLYADSARIGAVTNPEIQHLAGVNGPIQTQLNTKLEGIPDDSVGTLKLSADAVVSSKIADAAVATEKIADGAVAEAKIAVNAVTSGKIADSSVLTAKIADDAVSTIKIVNGAVTTAKILDSAVLAEKLAASAVITDKIADSAVTTLKIADLAITDAKISEAAEIAMSKIAGLDEALDTKSPIDSPTFTGSVVLPSTTAIGSVDATEIGYLSGVTSSVQTQITAAATALSTHEADTTNIHGIADTSLLATTANVATAKTEAIAAAGTAADTKVSDAVAALTKSSVGLANVDNTSDEDKPVSTAQASAIATAKSEAIADATAQVNAVIASAPAALNTLDELAAALGDDANFASTVTTSLAAKAPINDPTFTGTVTVAASGVAFTDGAQTKAGVPSLTTIGTTISGAYNLSTGGLALRDQLIPVSGAHAITVPTNATTAYPVGTSISFYQSAGTDANFVEASGVTILRTPGLKLRALSSSATLTKVATDTWLLAGDLKA